MLMPTFKEFRLQARISINQLSRRANVDFKTAQRADEGKPVQELKAIALIDALSEALGRKLTTQDIDDLKVV